jgi:hypothetical protein
MNSYKLLHFEDIDLDSVEDYYSVDIAFQNHTIQLDLNFTEETASKGSLDAVRQFIEGLDVYAAKAQAAIRNDFDTTDTVKDYIEHHLEDIDKDELDELLADSDKSIAVEQQLLAKFALVRAGFYPEDDDDFAMFDYTISRDITQYLIVVKFDNKGSVVDIAMES